MHPVAERTRQAAFRIFCPAGLFCVFAVVAGGASLLLGSGTVAIALHDSVGLASGVAVLIGLWLYRPNPIVPWALVAAAMLLYGSGDVVYAVNPAGGVTSLLSLGDWLYLCAGLSMVAAVAAFGDSRIRAARVSRLLFVDSTVFFLGAFLVMWFAVFDAQFDAAAGSALVRFLGTSFPIIDLLMLGLAARLLLTGAARLPAFGLLVGGIFFGLAGDLIWRGFLTDTNYGTLWVSGSFYICYGLIGAAALHPSMRELTSLETTGDSVMPTRRLPLLGASLATIPLVVLTCHAEIADPFGLVIFGVAATLIPALVVYRLVDLVAVARRLAAHAESSAGQFSALLGASPLPIGVLSPTGDVVLWNEAAEVVSGWHADEVIGRKWPTQAAVDDNQLARFRERALLGERLDRTEIALLSREDGEPRRVEVSTAPVWSGGRLEAVVAVFADVTEERQRQDELRYLAEHDALTGLLNRRSFQERLAAKVSRKDSDSLVLAVIDIDNFKLVNDSAGHLVGDQLLRSVAQMISSALRADDLCARLSGDEYAVLLSGATIEEAMEIIERLVETVRGHRLPIDGGSIDVTISGGLAVVPLAAGLVRNGEEALVHADTALYEAKNQGRNRAVAWDPALARHEQISSVRAWSSRIRQALEDGRVIIHLQPIVDLRDGSTVYHEALSRMVDEQGNLISPAAFLPHAHRLGLTEQIDRNAICLALELLNSDPELRIFVNLDPASFDNDGILDWLERTLRDQPKLAGRLGIEITERAPVRDYVRAQVRLSTLSSLGCLIAIDDFGSDFSSFEHLRALPADIVKIGDNFIAKLGSDPVTDALLNAVVSAAHALSKRVVAEGVETDAVASKLRLRGVEYAQGYLYGRPKPVELHTRIARVA